MHGMGRAPHEHAINIVRRLRSFDLGHDADESIAFRSYVTFGFARVPLLLVAVPQSEELLALRLQEADVGALAFHAFPEGGHEPPLVSR